MAYVESTPLGRPAVGLRSPRSLTWMAALGLSAALVVAALPTARPETFVAVSLLIALASVFVIKPLAALVVVILIHQSVDLWADGELATMAGLKFNLSTGLTLLLVVVGGAYLIENWQMVRTAPSTWPFMALVAMGVVGVMLAPAMGLAVPELMRLVRVAVVYGLVYALCRSRGELLAVLAAALASVLPVAIVAAHQVVTGEGGTPLGEFMFSRATGGFAEPDQLGIVAALVLGFSVMLLVLRDVPLRLLIAAVIGLVGVGLVGSYGRTGWIALVVGLIVAGAVSRRALLVLVPLAVIAVAVAVPSTVDRFDDLDAEVQYQGHHGNTFNERVSLWRDNLPKVNESALVGNGLGSIDDDSDRLIHNDYLRALVELGMLGFAAFVWLLLSALGGSLVAVRNSRRWRRPDLLAALAAGGVAVTVVYIVVSVTSNVITKPVSAGLAFTFVALAHAAGRIAKSDRIFGTPGRAP